jgi:hypothetical protein
MILDESRISTAPKVASLGNENVRSSSSCGLEVFGMMNNNLHFSLMQSHHKRTTLANVQLENALSSRAAYYWIASFTNTE